MANYNSLGAEIYVDDVFVGFIGQPIEMIAQNVSGHNLSGEDHTIKIKKPGYHTIKADIKIKCTGWWIFWGCDAWVDPEMTRISLAPFLIALGLTTLGVIGYMKGRSK